MTDRDPWVLLEGSNRSFRISNQLAVHSPIDINFDVTPQGKKVAERDARAIVAALNSRDAPKRSAPDIDWVKVADSLFSNGGSIQKTNPVVADVLLFLSYALRDGLT